MNLNFNFDGLTKLKTWWRIIKDNLSTIENAFNKEVTDRQSADSALQASIEAERSARQNGDSTLQSKLNSETSSRQSGDEALGQSIDNETAGRKAADNALQGSIDSETQAREQADSDLQTQINNLNIYSNKDDLYGTQKVKRTAELQIIWNDEPFPDEIDTSILNEKIDLSGNITDFDISVDGTAIFSTVFPDFAENFNGEITVGDTSDSQYITMFYDKNTGKCWLENTHTSQEDKYENGVYSFDIGCINAEYRYNDDWQDNGESEYTLLISYDLYGSPQYNPSFEYYDYRDVLFLKGGGTFLDAVNNNVENVNALTSQLSSFDVTLGEMQSTLGSLSQELDAVNGVTQ